MGRIKKYRMTPISKKFSEKGGFSAQFVGDGYSVVAEKEILPRIIDSTGIIAPAMKYCDCDGRAASPQAAAAR